MIGPARIACSASRKRCGLGVATPAPSGLPLRRGGRGALAIGSPKANGRAGLMGWQSVRGPRRRRGCFPGGPLRASPGYPLWAAALRSAG